MSSSSLRRVIVLLAATLWFWGDCQTVRLSFQNNSQFTIENNVLKGAEIFYPNDVINFGKSILECLETNLDSVGLVDAITGEEFTYRKMRERSVKCALWMKSQGLLPRDIIAICSDDRLDYMTPCLAALYLGATFSTWHANTDAEGCRHLMNIAKPKMVFVDEGSVAAVTEAVTRSELDIKIIVFESASGFFDFESIIAQSGIEDVEKFVCTPIKSLEEIAMILFSSGSTGQPKGIALTHGSLTQQQLQSQAFGISGNVCLRFLAPDWISAIATALMHIFLNVHRFISPEFEESSACALIEKHKATWIILSPTMINRMLKHSEAKEYDLSSVTKVIHCGSALSVPSYNHLAELLPNADIFSAYGSSELGSCFSIQTKKSKPGSCGQLLPNAQLKVVDIITGKTLGANQRGELLLKTPFMMPYYYNDPQATAQVFNEEGRLISGDFGYYDEDGEVFVIDRLKEIIRCADDDICPSDIESVILPYPGVKEVAVVGQPRDDEENVLVVFVVRTETFLENGKQVTENEILDLVPAGIRKNRRLRTVVEFIEEIPKTGNSKIRRLALRELARSMVGL